MPSDLNPLSSFCRTPTCARQTTTQKDRHSAIAYTVLASIASRGKNRCISPLTSTVGNSDVECYDLADGCVGLVNCPVG